MISDSEIKIIDDLECSFMGHECCMYVNLDYDTSGIWSDTPYHLYIVLFRDFEKEDWYKNKEEVIKALREIDEMFDYCGILDDSLEDIESFVEPVGKEVEE